jgi:predicted GIY-YIG superfamily endonuclease
MRQRAKRLDPVKRALLRRRKVIVEPVFGMVKEGEGFRRWTVRGLENVRTQWALVCTAYNLKKLAKAWKQRLAVGSAYNLKKLRKAWKNRLAFATCAFRARTATPALALEDAPLLPDSALRFEF